MRVAGINSNYNNFSSKGYTYNPNRKKTAVRLNPVNTYVDKLFSRSVDVSRNRILATMPELKPFTKEVSVKTKSSSTYAFDINDNNRKKYVMVLHGMGQNISALQPLYKSILDETEYAVFAPEYRGFGKNKPALINKKTFLEDTQAALDFLINEKQVKPEDICVVGHSLGGFIASQLVEKNPNIGRLVLVSSVESLEGEAMNPASKKYFPPFMLYLVKHFHFVRSYLRKTMNTSENLKNTQTPVDIIHSGNDRVVNCNEAKHLAKNCPNLQSIHILNSGGHSMESQKIDSIISLLK